MYYFTAFSEICQESARRLFRGLCKKQKKKGDSPFFFMTSNFSPLRRLFATVMPPAARL